MLHEKLKVYRFSIQLAEDISKDIANWPKGTGYLADQIKRAMASVVLNLAEGNARRSRTERRRFFEISRASLAEVLACLDLMRAFGLVDASRFNSIRSFIIVISKMLWGLINRHRFEHSSKSLSSSISLIA